MKRYDPLTKAERSERMSRIRNADTRPEIIVRHLVHGMGYRYRLHARDLPGNPDLVFRSRKKVVFVHGCFWHLHDCGQYRLPRTNRAFWNAKLARNKARDKDVCKRLHALGWSTLILWECQLKRISRLTTKIERFLEKQK